MSLMMRGGGHRDSYKRNNNIISDVLPLSVRPRPKVQYGTNLFLPHPVEMLHYGLVLDNGLLEVEVGVVEVLYSIGWDGWLGGGWRDVTGSHRLHLLI